MNRYLIAQAILWAILVAFLYFWAMPRLCHP